jgi:hypothetical protein
MHLILDGSVLPALLVLAITIWACGSYVVDLFKGSKLIVSLIAAVALVLATVITVMAFVRM